MTAAARPLAALFATSSRMLIGATAWVALVACSVPHVLDSSWAHAILTYAALVLAPLLLDLSGAALGARSRSLLRVLSLPAALLLIPACRMEPGPRALLLAAPWIGVTAWLALAGAGRILGGEHTPLPRLCRNVGLVYLTVGGAWLGADRWGLRPLGFGADIVLLTAIHFHYAGWVLPVVSGCALAQSPGSVTARACAWGVLAGIPLVAIGITATQLGAPPVVELLAVACLPLAALGVAALHLTLALEDRWPAPVRALWAVAAVALVFSMALAAAYAVRAFVPVVPWLDIPWMRALHGTANAFGFALPALIAWRRAGAAPA